MSLRDFWINVRVGARLISPDVTADSPRIDSADIRRVLQGATIWLTPNSVKGFDERDFNFLDPDEREVLTRSVTRFREIAQRVPPDKPATDNDIQQALPEFQRIVEITAPNRYADPEAFKIGKILEKHIGDRVPPSVLEMRFETGQDSNGGKGLWIWVVFKDEIANETDVLSANATAVKKLIADAVREAGIKRWPYVRFRAESELEAVESKS